jgi:peroxiredoxin
LRGIQRHIDEFTAQRVKPVAISVDSPDVSRNFKQRRGFTFTFLSDPSAEVIRRYDLLHVGGGLGEHDISRPAEFLLDSSGTVRWVNFTEDVRVRARADEMLSVARDINKVVAVPLGAKTTPIRR